MIRILHVLNVMNYAGTETMLMNLYRNIDRSKIQFDFAVCEKKAGDYDEEIRLMGGKLIQYPRYQGFNHNKYITWWKGFFNNNKDYKIVHGHIGSTAAIYLHIAKKAGCYTIAHSHATDGTLQSLTDKLYKLFSFPTRWTADYFMGCSYAALSDRYGKKVAENPVISKVFYNAIDIEKYKFNETVRKSVRKEFSISQNTLVLGTVGRLTEVKNPFFIIEILKCLKKTELQFVLLWFGRGELEQEIHEAVSANGLEAQVIMGGIRSDICRMLQAMDIFLFPSIYEGLGITCIEAQAADLTCLCSDTIPKEACVTERFKALSIGEANTWVKQILYEAAKEKVPRHDRTLELRNAGYDIREQAEWLTDFYISKGNENV